MHTQRYTVRKKEIQQQQTTQGITCVHQRNEITLCAYAHILVLFTEQAERTGNKTDAKRLFKLSKRVQNSHNKVSTLLR